MTPQELVQAYLNNNYRVVFWRPTGDLKGPTAKGWQHKPYTMTDYQEGDRVGLITGHEILPGRFIHDIDIDWAAGSSIAQALLPPTGFVFGRHSKKISHCFYTLPEALPSYRYEDIDKTCLIELRGTKINGEVGLQTMAPPSVWSKGPQREALAFVKYEAPSHLENIALLKQRVCLSAIGMIFAKHLGKKGFGHEPRLCWAGFLLRAGVSPEDLKLVGRAIALALGNEVADVERTIESTLAALTTDSKKVKGGPALAKLLGTKGKSVLARVNEWLGHEGDFIRDQNGHIVAKNQENIKRAVEMLGHELSYNQFSEQLLMDGQKLEDPQWKGLYLHIDREYRFQPPVDFYRMVVEDQAWHNGFHPVRDYLNALVWDGQPRIDTWLMQAASAENSDYVRALSAIMLIAGVRRIREPGCKYDEMVVWESEQGSGKSSAAQALCPHTAWFSDDLRLNLHSQQLIEATLGKWIIEASDLAGKRKTEIEQLKAMMSRQVDGPARMAYAHFPVERPRHFILIGTTNSSAYLTDPTGARRFWPMAVKKFNVAWVVAHRDQLWAEAAVREALRESIRLKEELWPEACVEQEKRREIDPWESLLRALLLGVEPGSGGRRRVTSNALWDALSIAVERRDRIGSLRITEIMHRFGFKRTRVRPQGEDVQVGFIEEHLGRLELPEGDEIPSREPGEDDGEF